MISVDNILEQKFPKLAPQSFVFKVLSGVLRKLFHENEFTSFGCRYPHLKGVEFVEQVLEEFNVSTEVNSDHLERIPAHGRVVIVANHPIGSLDGLAMIREVTKIRRDVKVVATQVLSEIKPMEPLLISVDNIENKILKSYYKKIDVHLNNEGALLIFPAGEVSRVTPLGIRDGSWHAGFLRIAYRASAPILPVFIDARNSLTFYVTSMVYRPLSTLMLVPEMFKLRNSVIRLKIGNIIPFASFERQALDSKAMVKLFAKHVYRLGADKSGLFKTAKAIAHPENRQALREAILDCETLGETRDGKKIVLFQGETSSPIMREIGRLREFTFREVGEGTGQRRDYDHYDTYYHHIIVWDDVDLEVVGAYRVGCVDQIMATGNEIYTQSLFDFEDAMAPYFSHCLELGRSFVQPKYWGKRSLDYLWQGIGAFIKQRPQYRYLLGPLTVPNNLPDLARKALIYVFNKHFNGGVLLARAKHPFHLLDDMNFASQFDGEDFDTDMKQLKYFCAGMGASIPTLFKQYPDLCEPEGLRCLDWGVDPDFSNAVDGLIMMDMTLLHDKKRQRYLG